MPFQPQRYANFANAAARPKKPADPIIPIPQGHKFAVQTNSKTSQASVDMFDRLNKQRVVPPVASNTAWINSDQGKVLVNAADNTPIAGLAAKVPARPKKGVLALSAAEKAAAAKRQGGFFNGIGRDAKQAWKAATNKGKSGFGTRVGRVWNTGTGKALMIGVPAVAAGAGILALMNRRRQDDAQYGYGHTVNFSYLPETRQAMAKFAR